MIIFILTIFLIYLIWILFLIKGLFYSFEKTDRLPHFISVIIAAHNEAANLPALLESLQSQTFPQNKFEIIIVDDRSSDDSPKILNEWQQKLPNLRVIRIEETSLNMPAKKFALSLGIEKSRSEILLFTDADCRPAATWIEATLPCFTRETGIVVGFAPLQAQKNGFLQKFTAIESVFDNLVAKAGLAWQIPMTATGRNLAYRKSVYEKVNGFTPIAHSISGDDDLFLHLVRKKTSYKLAFADTPKSTVVSSPPMSWKHFFSQRIRHFSAGKYYNFPSKILYGLFYLSHTILLLLPVLLFFGKHSWLIAGLFVTKLLIDFTIFTTAQRKFKFDLPMNMMFFWEYFYPAEVWIIGILSFFLPIHWKENSSVESYDQ
ncbi:beta-monoglucosyldiacylglycerol synthase [bacterium BMS3Abin05]|nr:beta-monoglucosyldiacylglycerol synthase [bacterium BMS3Abin05]